MSPLSVGTSRSTHALETGEAKLWSLLVGVNDYADEHLPCLRYSASDCQGLKTALAEATQGFPRKEAIVHHDFSEHSSTLAEVRESLQQIVAAAKSEDTILLYFSGHGVLDPNSHQVFLCLADTCKDDLGHTGLGLSEVLQLLGNSAVHSQMLWLDACHSGDMTLRGGKGEAQKTPVLNGTNELVEVLRQRAAQSKGFYALLSCDQKQRSWEFPELKHGLFTYYLMRGLQGEAADAQGVIDADGLYKYVYHQTLQYIDKTNQQLRLINQQKRIRGEIDLHSEYPLQTPKRIVEGVGELVLGLKTDRITVVNRRRAIVIDGLPNNDKTLALSKVLRKAGNFELECWSQSGKAWTEVRNAIQTCLRSQTNTLPSEPLTFSGSIKQTTTVLLYLRGKIEQIEDGEAWLVLGDNVKLSRSWLRQELRRTETAQQIVVLDCPEASSLSEWVEELQLASGHGQCLIAAAAPFDRPEQFTQALLETLSAHESHLSLPVAGWINKLQVCLEAQDIPVQTWLSGAQGVIEILPKTSSIVSNVNTSQSSATVDDSVDRVRLDIIDSVLEDTQTLEPSGSTLSATTPSKYFLPLESFQGQYSQLKNILTELLGPIAPTLLRQVATPASNPQTWVDNLMPHLLPHQQTQLKQQASRLQASTFQPQTKSSDAPSLQYLAIPESFVHQCEKALAICIGPIASFLVEKALNSHPQISSTELVEILAAEISDSQKAVEFRKRLFLE